MKHLIENSKNLKYIESTRRHHDLLDQHRLVMPGEQGLIGSLNIPINIHLEPDFIQTGCSDNIELEHILLMMGYSGNRRERISLIEETMMRDDLAIDFDQLRADRIDEMSEQLCEIINRWGLADQTHHSRCLR